ncbi:MAG TPA: nucleotidyltransferase domain-containing protein [Pseudobdellovibrionaceae bacterium]|jgi:predicted nucleotidyltransferase
MRLSFKEQEGIKNAIGACLQEIPFKLYLFGSRADDKKKGGDIDLLLLVPASEKETVVELKNKIRIKIFETLSEQRIDITVAIEQECASDEFLRSILRGAIPLSGRGSFK